MKEIWLALGFCACALEPRAMVPPPLDSRHSPLHGAVGIAKVGGGEEKVTSGSSKVANQQLREALRMSLDQDGFLAPPGEKPAFALDAFLVEMKRSDAGFTMKIDSFIRYKVTSNRDGKVVFDDIITASCTKNVDDGFWDVTRLQLAREGAVRANIEELLSRLNSMGEGAR